MKNVKETKIFIEKYLNKIIYKTIKYNTRRKK